MARRSYWLLTLTVLLAGVGVASCGNSNIPKIGIQVDPLCVSFAPGGTQQFSARVFIDDVDQGVNNNAVVWSVLGGDVNGVISNDAGNAGFYTSPNTNPPPAAQVTVIATSKEDSQKQGQATVVLSGACPVVPPPP